jgi:hypothetical protein
MNRVVLEKLIVDQSFKEFSDVYETGRFLAVLTSVYR